MSTYRILVGDCRESLATLPDASVQCCVTSPPYWGLRDYGHDGQLGLEQTPDEYVARMVAVFREVRRVLRDDGTLWLNLGDSYAAGRGGTAMPAETLAGGIGGKGDANAHRGRLAQVPNTKNPSAPIATYQPHRNAGAIGLKHKDLIGIPWRVAFALQQPYYAGSIKDERDRIWLAAMLDAEGCLFIHKRKTGQHNGQGYHRKNDNYSPGVEICNTSMAMVERISALVGKGSISTSEKGRHGRKQTLYRWNLRTTESRDFVREIYPYLVAKRQQARILFGCPSSGERAEAAHAALIGLHNGNDTDVDFPDPPGMTEPGFYLRSEIIWSKSNPMPESVTDRPTKAHEQVFLLSKSARYYYDADAIAEPITESSIARLSQDVESQTGSDRVPGKTNGRMKAVGPRFGGNKYGDDESEQSRTKSGNAYTGGDGTRNARTVWTIATQPFSGAHFATFPPELAERCIKAGSRPGDTVLDTFAGSGTTGMVATGHGRSAILCELNPEYVHLIRERCGPMLEVA